MRYQNTTLARSKTRQNPAILNNLWYCGIGLMAGQLSDLAVQIESPGTPAFPGGFHRARASAPRERVLFIPTTPQSDTGRAERSGTLRRLALQLGEERKGGGIPPSNRYRGLDPVGAGSRCPDNEGYHALCRSP